MFPGVKRKAEGNRTAAVETARGLLRALLRRLGWARLDDDEKKSGSQPR